MKPNISNNIGKKLFNYFTITKTYSIKKFIPNNKEKWKEQKFEKKDLDYGTYLFTQDNFNNKAFDAAIIDIKTNNIAKIYLLQISINKQDIFSIEVLRKYLLLFKNYFERQFSFIIQEKNIYFTYIFFTKNKEELFKDCNNNGMKCIFFNPSQKVFIDKNNFDLNYLTNIEEIFVSPFRKKEANDIDIYMKNLNIQGIPINKINIHLTVEQFNNLLVCIKNIFNINKNISITFSHNRFIIDESSLDSYTFILREIKSDELDDWKFCIEGGEEKYKKIVNKIKKCKNKYKTINIENDDDDNNNNNKKQKLDNKKNNNWKQHFKLLLYKNIRLQAKLIFPNGIIVSLNKIPLNNKNNLIYNICHFSLIDN